MSIRGRLNTGNLDRGITFEQAVGRFGPMALMLIMSAVIVDTGFTLTTAVCLLLFVLSFVIIRNKLYIVPFVMYAAIYTVTLLLGVLYMGKAFEWNFIFSNYYLYFSEEKFWLFLHLTLVGVGVAITSAVLGEPIPSQRAFVLNPLLILFVWHVALAITLFQLIYMKDNLNIISGIFFPAVTAITINHINRHGWRLVILIISITPYVFSGSRWVLGLIVLWFLALLAYGYMGRLYSYRKFFLNAIITGALSILIFVLSTFYKYGGDTLIYVINDAIRRLVFTVAHATLSIKAKGITLPNGMLYWLSLLPGIDKPYTTGHLIYEISRTSTISADRVPYLPPTAPAELYMTTGMMGLVVGSVLLGMLLALCWFFALKLKKCALSSAFFVGECVVLCGIGGTDLYGRLSSCRQIFYVYVFFIMLTILFGRQRIYAHA